MKWIFVILLLLFLIPVSVSAATGFQCNGDTETFEGNFPPSGWSTSCYNAPNTSSGCWINGTGHAGGGMSGLQAQSVYGDLLLDTILYSPSLSTENMQSVNVQFESYMYFYTSLPAWNNYCNLDYTTDGVTWHLLKQWNELGVQVNESINLPVDVLNQPSVQLRWERNTISYPYYYGVIDNVKMTCEKIPDPFNTVSIDSTAQMIQMVIMIGVMLLILAAIAMLILGYLPD